VLGYLINIPFDIFEGPYPEFNPGKGAAEGTLVMGAAKGYRQQEAVGFTGRPYYYLFVIHTISVRFFPGL
jgi:hypothetical protein